MKVTTVASLAILLLTIGSSAFAQEKGRGEEHRTFNPGKPPSRARTRAMNCSKVRSKTGSMTPSKASKVNQCARPRCASSLASAC